MAIKDTGKNKAADKVAEGEGTGFSQVPEKADQLSRIVKQPELIKVLEEIIAQPADKREEFVEKNLDRESLNNRGIRLKGARLRFKPARAAKEGKAPKRIVSFDIVVPEVGTLSLRSPY